MYAGVPPPAVTHALPVPPLQLIDVDEPMLAVNTAGCVILTVVVFVHPFESVTVTV